MDIKPYFDAGREYHEYLAAPDSIAVLAPGQEWRTLWDSAVAREEYEFHRRMNPQLDIHELRNTFVGHIEYDDKMISDRTTRHLKNPISLDTSMFRNTERFSEGHEV